MQVPLLTPTDFVALVNQTLEFAYPYVDIEGEVRNLKISRSRWIYLDITDEVSKIRCFGIANLLPAPIEDGMKVRIGASPRMHPQYGFSLNLQSIQFSGEGTIRKAADLLHAKLEAEGLFAVERKRSLPYPPQRIGLITSEESAGYRDFIKVLSARFGGISIELANVQVQGSRAVQQNVDAIEWFNRQAKTVDAIVLVRGGGSTDDLQAYSSEQMARAVAASRIPTLVAIGHEVDVSLAELAADLRASTPSNAAELLVPDRRELLGYLDRQQDQLHESALKLIVSANDDALEVRNSLSENALQLIEDCVRDINHSKRTLETLNPAAVLSRGYAIVRKSDKALRSSDQVKAGDEIKVQLMDGHFKAEVQ